MDDRSSSPSTLAVTDRVERRANQDTIYLAVELLKSQHSATEARAFTMLVQASTDRQMSIGDIAELLADEAVVPTGTRQRAARIVRQRRHD
jgi:AmiR/NasT family two-component response regulator